MKLSALLAILLVSAWSGVDANTQANTNQLTISAPFADQTVTPTSQIELHLSRALLPNEGRMAVFLGSTDITGLIETSATRLGYRPWPLPLPLGDNRVTVFLVSPKGEWKQIAQFAVRVTGGAKALQSQSRTEALDQTSAGPSPTQTRQERRGLPLIPSLTITTRSQPAMWHTPALPRTERTTFSAFALQSSLQTNVQRSAFGWQSQFDIVGSSFKPETLRYGLLNNKAPNIDLSGYLMQFRLGKVNMNAGHFTYGSNKHLISDFASRGLTLSLPINKHADFSVAAVNGTNIVGWDNFFGLDERDHQVVSGKLGYELFPERRGGLRLEASILSGSLLPLSNYNQGNINDAEKSRGASLRVRASDPAQRWQLDAGFARSRSTNPNDPLLNPAGERVGVRAATRNAWYLETSYKLLSDVALTSNTKASLQLNFQLERVDPWFRSVAVDLQPNKLFRQIGLVANIGELTAVYAQQRFNDNLDDVPSLLKTLTRRHSIMLGLPLTALLGEPQDGEGMAWLPHLLYSYDHTHQFGAGIPLNADFKEPQIPNQVGINHTLTAEWQSRRWRYAYRLNHSTQDNFGLNRADAQMRNWVNGLTLGFSPHTAFDVNFDLNLEQTLNRDENANKDRRRSDRTLRFGLLANWRPTARMTLSANWANTGMRSRGDLSLASANRNAQLDLQWTWRFLGHSQTDSETPAVLRAKLRGQFFLRYIQRLTRSNNELLKQNEFRRSDALNLGLSFTFF
jgi:hypothetical protein